jgi:hypothetical protein
MYGEVKRMESQHRGRRPLDCDTAPWRADLLHISEIDGMNGLELEACHVHLSGLGHLCSSADGPPEDEGEVDSSACYVGQLHEIDAKLPQVMIMKGEDMLGNLPDVNSASHQIQVIEIATDHWIMSEWSVDGKHFGVSPELLMFGRRCSRARGFCGRFGQARM